MSTILPTELLSSLEGLPGFDASSFGQVHAAGAQVVSIRFNPAKLKPGAYPLANDHSDPLDRSGDALSNIFGDTLNLSARKIPWSSLGYYLPERPSFTLDPLFHAGVYYVQEASSMFLEQALKQTVDLSQPLRVLDLCAAPGGKSTLIQSLISKDSLLVSNEVIRSRAGILQENITKWGAANTIISQNDPEDFGRLENYFDAIVVDAPCSGSGLFRRDPDAIKEWSPANVQLCSERQKRILADCWPALKPGGILIYSTCSYSRQEDEDILDWIKTQLDTGAASQRLTIAEEWNIIEVCTETGFYGYRFYPDRLDGEGFFIACIKKEDGPSVQAQQKSQHAKRSIGKQTDTGKLSRQETETIESWILNDPGIPFYFFRHADLIHLLPGGMADDLSLLRSKLYLRKAGLTLGQLGSREFIPEHDLAMSPMTAQQIPAIALSREEAIRYLRKDELSSEIVPSNAQKGWSLVQYEGTPLGWVKILSNRINNYYPKEWRILKR